MLSLNAIAAELNTSMKNQYYWLDRNEYPFQFNYKRLPAGNMHYVDEGNGEPIVMVHGTPSWSFLYRKLIKTLSVNYRCIAPDHIGFGLSDKPSNWSYQPEDHACNLEIFLEDLNLKNITLIVHDFGGPIGLSYAIKHPDRIKNIVVLNTWMWSNENNVEAQKLLKVIKSPILPFLYKYLNFSARVLIPYAAGKPSFFSKSIHGQYIKPFSKPSERMGTIGFAKALNGSNEWFEHLWEQRRLLKDKRSLIVWGMKDKFITPAYLATWKQVFPEAKVMESMHSGHWVQEEESNLPVWITEFLALDKG
jgi:haloalkane dehalogenase